MLDILSRIPAFVFCPGGIVVAIVGAILLLRKKTRPGLALILGGAFIAILYIGVILLSLFDFY